MSLHCELDFLKSHDIKVALYMILPIVFRQKGWQQFKTSLHKNIFPMCYINVCYHGTEYHLHNSHPAGKHLWAPRRAWWAWWACDCLSETNIGPTWAKHWEFPYITVRSINWIPRENVNNRNTSKLSCVVWCMMGRLLLVRYKNTWN